LRVEHTYKEKEGEKLSMNRKYKSTLIKIIIIIIKIIIMINIKNNTTPQITKD